MTAPFFAPQEIVSTLGLLGVFGTLFVETGLLIGLVLPGDSLLFVAGLAASESALLAVGVQLSLPLLLIFAPIAAFLGTQTGYLFGRRYGRSLFNRPDGKMFTAAKVHHAEEWLHRYGPFKAMLLGRFIPIVRTLMPPLYGMLNMDVKKFTLLNLISAVIWTDSVLLLGYILGERVKGSVDKYLLPIIGLVIIVSFIPIAIEIIKARKKTS
jgi:membrane-associated protein